MTSSLDASIVPITLTVNGRTGLTLWAPPWEDDDGEEWQGFLGDGAKILLYPGTQELGAFIASGEENDLSDHPAWGRVQKLRPDQLRPGSEDSYDLDAVYEWAAGEPDPLTVSALANVVDMTANIAECCDDGALRRLVENTPAYELLVADDVSYQGKQGKRDWAELGDTIAKTWARAIVRVESWLSWQGEFTDSDLPGQSMWERVGAQPIQIRLPEATYLTVRGYVPGESVTGVGAADEDESERAEFLGTEDTVAVFSDAAGLARYCRTVRNHALSKLEWWSELVESADDDAFEPGADVAYDLRRPSAMGAQLMRELAVFCRLDLDTSVLDTANVSGDDWRGLLDQVVTCLEPQD